MTQRRTYLLVLGAGLLACAFGAGYGMSVLAQGAPTAQPLFYSGVLDVNGEPANGEYKVKLELFAAASGGDALCGVEQDAQVAGGHFRIDASDCVEALEDEPDAWVAISFVDADGIEHAIDTRSKIGAVPYALEANHALSASQPSGALADTIEDLTARVKALEAGSAHSSAFLVHKSSMQTITDEKPAVVLFDEVKVDVADEYDPKEGKFTAKANGLYEFSCTIVWDVEANTPGTWEVALALNGFEHTFSGAYTDGQATTRTLTSVIELERGDGVTCTALQSVPMADLFLAAESYNTFTGHRIR